MESVIQLVSYRNYVQ